MSSPLSMLKKTRRTPLQGAPNEQWGRHKVPFKRNLLKEIQAEIADNDETSDPPLTSHTHTSDGSTSKSKAPLKKGAPPSDFELMSAMMQRVSLLEKTVRSQAQEIKCKNKKIAALEEKRRLQKESESAHDLSDRDDLERKCQQLQNQVCEMESFLNDYGLIWVGEGQSGADSTSVLGSFRMNFDLVLQRIRELNILAGEGECFVQSTVTGAQLAKKDPIQLSLYSNGIIMFEGPFRSYQEHSTQRCMQDLMDGFFPSELQDRFPDGVPFEVRDRRDEDFVPRLPWNTFPGEGQAVQGEGEESVKAVSSQLPGKTLSMDQFLNMLPKVLVKAGRVIDVRASMRAKLQGSSGAQSSSSVILIDTPALQMMDERPQTSSADWNPSAPDVITLKVKSEDGNHTYILKMCLSETIGHLRQHLDQHRGGGLPGYDIISAYPTCCYNDDQQTLQSCGLTTDAALLLRKRKHSHSLTEVKK